MNVDYIDTSNEEVQNENDKNDVNIFKETEEQPKVKEDAEEEEEANNDQADEKEKEEENEELNEALLSNILIYLVDEDGKNTCIFVYL